MWIVFIGPPGAGKGTQCSRLADSLGVPHLSTGDMLRDTERDSPLGKVVASYIDVGRLAPDYLVMPIVTNRLAESDCQAGCLFDGFPRTVHQAELLSEFLMQRQRRIDAVLHLQVDPEVLLGRLLKRAVLQNRKDDNEETISARLEVYRTQTAPVLQYYRGQGNVLEIDWRSVSRPRISRHFDWLGITKVVSTLATIADWAVQWTGVGRGAS